MNFVLHDLLVDTTMGTVGSVLGDMLNACWKKSGTIDTIPLKTNMKYASFKLLP